MKNQKLIFSFLMTVLVIVLLFKLQEDTLKDNLQEQTETLSSQTPALPAVNAVAPKITAAPANPAPAQNEEPTTAKGQNQITSMADFKEARRNANPYDRLFRIAESYPSSRDKNLFFSYGIRVAPVLRSKDDESALASVSGFAYFAENSAGEQAKFYAVFDTARGATGAYTGRFVVQTNQDLDKSSLEKSQLVIAEKVEGINHLYFIADLEKDPQVESLGQRISKLAGVKKYYPEVLWGRARH
jgi:hypothetical protein